MKSGIYQIQHIDSGRRYIGSSVDVKQRLQNHRSSLRRGDNASVLLQRAWIKYGESSFYFQKILVCRPEDMIVYENAAIRAFESNVSGYNIRLSAESCRGLPSPKMTHKPGDRYGRLTLMQIVSRGAAGIRAIYACDCGKQTEAHANAVRCGNTSSCGCFCLEYRSSPKDKFVPGDRVGRMTFISRAETTNNGKSRWKIMCDCGTSKVVLAASVIAGSTRSCGCLVKENPGRRGWPK